MGQIRKKKSNIEKKIVRDPEGKNRMAKKTQKQKPKKIPRSISKSPLAIYNKEGTNRNGQKPKAGLRKKIPNTNEEGIN